MNGDKHPRPLLHLGGKLSRLGGLSLPDIGLHSHLSQSSQWGHPLDYYAGVADYGGIVPGGITTGLVSDQLSPGCPQLLSSSDKGHRRSVAAH